VAWLGGNGVVHINQFTVCRAGFIPRSVTVYCLHVYYLFVNLDRPSGCLIVVATAWEKNDEFCLTVDPGRGLLAY